MNMYTVATQRDWFSVHKQRMWTHNSVLKLVNYRPLFNSFITRC